MTYKKEIRRMRWLAAMLMLVTAMVVPAGAWAENTITPSKPSGEGTEASPYQIGTAAELYWFAGLVNGTLTDGTAQKKDACAKLTDSITVNTSVLDASGNLSNNGSGLIRWTTIGNSSEKYTGTFDGNGKTISGLYFNNGGQSYVGLFGWIDGGTVKNVGVVDSYINGGNNTGGLCGQNNGTISNCYYIGSVSGNYYVGGLCGNNTTKCTISNCYYIGSVSGNGTFVGGFCGMNNGTIKHCYYNSQIYTGNAVGYNIGTVEKVEGKTTAQFKSGEVAWLLNEGTAGGTLVWYQNIDVGTADDYPVFDSGHETVRQCSPCTGVYTNTNDTIVPHDYDNGGTCTKCGHSFYEPAILSDGVYQIGNYSQLYWFAQQVNNDNEHYGKAKAVLTADITVNTDVLDESGNLVSNVSGFRNWTPIGNSSSNAYSGTFDGQGHTISGLYFNNTETDSVGLFGRSSGTIKNLGVVNSYIKGNNYVGAVCGINNGSGKIENCYNVGYVDGNRHQVGGLCGSNNGEIACSYNKGTVAGVQLVGGVCGLNENGTIANCYNAGSVSGTGYNIGGVCGINRAMEPNVTSTITNCYNIGNVSGSENVGGVCGKNVTDNGGSSTIINCYYDSNKFTGPASCGHSKYYINVCGKTTKQFKSGEVAYLLDALSDTYNSNDTDIDWGQKIGEDDFPVLGGKRVYATKGCTTYSNEESATEKAHSFGDGDVCTVCGSYRPAEKDDNGIYQIGSVNDLYWFAQQVNSGNTEISAVLTADITINEGVLKADGTLADDPSGLKQWQPIAYYGQKAASGTFDGNGHTISGLYVNDPSRSCVGLFANLSEKATVKNLIIKDSYISGSGSVGGVCGFSFGTIANCGFIGAVSGKIYVGGVCGCNNKTQISNSYFNGTVSGNDNVGGVYGLNDEASTITNCYYLASEDDNKGGKTAAQFKSGEVAWLLNGSTSEGTDEAPLVWYQNISGESVVKYPVLNNSHQVVKACYITLPESTPHGSVKVSNMDGEELTPNSENKIFAAKGLNVKIEAIPDESESVVYKVKSFKVMAGENEITSNDPLAITEEVTVTAEFELDWIVVSGIKYQVLANKSNEVAAMGKVGSATALTIPASVTSPDNNELSYAVTQIADNAFANDAAITSVEISASIVSIGVKAFSGCSSLVDIRFTGTVPPTTIGEGAFDGIHADALITVPALSVDAYKTALGDALASKVIADKGVITLTHNQGGKINVYVVNGDTETLQTPAEGKVLVDWGTQVKIEAVADEGYVFEWLKINDESLGNDVNIHTVKIMRYSPSTVSGQGENFGDITAEASFSVKIATSGGGGNESVTIKGSIDTTGGTQTIIVTHCAEGTESATIPEALGASGTTYIPVTSIAASAFEGCAVLKSVEIPSSITTIGSYAFKGCTSLESFKIKKTTTAMPSPSTTRAAARAAADVAVPVVEANAFDDIVDKATLYVPEGWKEAFKADSEWGKFSKIKEYRDDENETVLAELTLTASAGGSLTVGAVTSTNDTQTVKVAEGSEVTVTITPAEGYILGSLLYGGQDVMAQVVDGTLTLTSLEGENTLAAVFGVDTGIGAVYDMSKTVYVRDGRIIVDGAAVGEVVIVCDAAGRVLRREVANGEPIELPMAAGKVYIVRIGKQVIKLTM